MCVCVHPDSKLRVLAMTCCFNLRKQGAEAPIQTPLLTKLVCVR